MERRMIFSDEFYATAISVILKEENFSDNINKFGDEFFNENEKFYKIFRNAKAMVKKYGFINLKMFKEECPKGYELVKEKRAPELEDYVKANLKKMIRITSTKRFMDKAVEEMQKDFHEINDEELMKNMLLLEDSVIIDENKTLDYFENPARRITKLSNVTGTPTGWYNIDRRLFGGGLCDGDLGIILALPNTGKSATLVNLAIMAATYGKQVLYITLEMPDYMIAHRCDMRLMGLTQSEVFSDIYSVTKRLKEFKKMTGSSLKIHKFNNRNETVKDIRKLIIDLKRFKGFDTNFLVVDYADLIKTNRVYSREDLGSKEIYEDLRVLGNEMNMGVWTASQSNRSGNETKVLDMSKFADAFSKGFVGDIVISINQNKKQKEEKRAFYYIAKNRNKEAGFGDTLYADWDRMTLVDVSDSEIFYTPLKENS